MFSPEATGGPVNTMACSLSKSSKGAKEAGSGLRAPPAWVGRVHNASTGKDHSLSHETDAGEE